MPDLQGGEWQYRQKSKKLMVFFLAARTRRSKQGGQFETAEYVDKLWNTLPRMRHYEKFFGCRRIGEHVA